MKAMSVAISGAAEDDLLSPSTRVIEGELHRRRNKGPEKSVYGDTESHQYEGDESEVWKHHQLQRKFEDRGRWWTFSKKRETITSLKMTVFYSLVEKEVSQNLLFGTAFLFLWACNVGLGICAWLTVYLEPLAAGSGIPEVKCFLNGLNIPRLVVARTLICKSIGMIFSCSCGLPLGKEGPMVHVGAVIAAGVSQGYGQSKNADFNQNQDFRNDKEKRDFVVCGSAAGVAAAFGAPIGGVLFGLEEGASFWSTKLTWRCFFCAMTTVFTGILLYTANSAFGHSDSGAMFSFGEFFSLQGEKSNYSVWELWLFTMLGGLGGMIGALFVYLNATLSQWRLQCYGPGKSYCGISPHIWKLLEVIVIITIMTSIAFFLPLYFNHCTPLPVDMEEWSNQEKLLVDKLVSLYCQKETHYNELASLYLTDPDTAIKQLFHFREVGDMKFNSSATFGSVALFYFFVPYLLMACITCGCAMPAGLFVPSLLSGAALGRLVGHLLHKLDNTRGTFADSGTYALMGASAITGGIARMTISLTVMVLEGTGDMQYVLPLMLTVMGARLIGNIYTEGQYDKHMHIRKLNYLEEEECVSDLAEMVHLTVSDIMTPHPVCLQTVVRVGELYDMLSERKHNCFPIVDIKHGDIFVGTVLRKVLCVLLKARAFGDAKANPTSEQRISPMVSWGALENMYPDFPDVDSVQLLESDRNCWLDLRPYIDTSPYVIFGQASIQRTYGMFRTLGLRHLCVINKYNQVVGIVTRADLVTTHTLASNKDSVENFDSHEL